MKSIKAGVSILFLFTVAFANAQNFSMSWGTEKRTKYKFDDAVQLTNGNSLVVKLKQKTNSYGIYFIPILSLLDSSMEIIKENQIKFDEKNTHIQGFEKCGNNIFFLYDAYNMDNKKTSVYAVKIDEQTLMPSGKVVLGIYDSENMQNQAQTSYKLSQDSSKLFLFVEGPERRKENKKICISIFDTELNKIWNREIELPIQERYVSIYDKDVTDDGKVFVAIKHYEKEVTRQSVMEDGKLTPSYIYKLLLFSNESGKDGEFAFNLNDKFIHQSKILYNKNGTVTAAGLFKKKPYNYSNLTGIFYIQFNVSDSKVKEPMIMDFSKDIIEKIKKDRFASNSDVDPGLHNSFKVVDIIARNDGSVDLISEYQTQISSSPIGFGLMGAGISAAAGATSITYQFGDILNTHIDKSGSAVFTRIPKNQKYPSPEMLSYYPLIYQDKLLFLFNDDKDNVERDLDKRPDGISNMGKSVLVTATIDADGELNRKIIYDSGEDNFALVPRSIKKLSENSYLINTRLMDLFKNRERLGTLKIE